MKKLLSCIALVSLGFSTSVFAADVLVASGGYYATSYVAPGCSWTTFTLATSGGQYTESNLSCSGVRVATTNYYSGGPGAIVATNANYYAVRRDGTQGANGYDYAVYKKAASQPICGAPYKMQIGTGNYTDLSQASTAASMQSYYNAAACPAAKGCHYDIVAVTGGYQVWCK